MEKLPRESCPSRAFESTREERSRFGVVIGETAEPIPHEKLSATDRGIAWSRTVELHLGSGIRSHFPTGSASSAVAQGAKPASRAESSTDEHPKPEPASPWQILTAGTANRNAMRRAEAVAALGTIGPSRRAVSLIERALGDKDPSIRQLAAMITRRNPRSQLDPEAQTSPP